LANVFCTHQENVDTGRTEFVGVIKFSNNK
jgi:hypothetical protein